MAMGAGNHRRGDSDHSTVATLAGMALAATDRNPAVDDDVWRFRNYPRRLESTFACPRRNRLGPGDVCRLRSAVSGDGPADSDFGRCRKDSVLCCFRECRDGSVRTGAIQIQQRQVLLDGRSPLHDHQPLCLGLFHKPQSSRPVPGPGSRSADLVDPGPVP